MNTKKGIVMKIENSTIFLMTSDGEFVKVRLNKKESLPIIGSEYCGEIIKPSFIKSNIFKYASAACLMLFTLFGGGGAYAYYKPVSTVTITTDPSIELKSNIWGKVISANPINENGKKILEEVSLKNKAVDDALLLVLDQSKKDNFIDDSYVKNNKTVQISVKGKKLNLSSFEKKIGKDTLSVQIDNNGTIINNKNSKTKNSVSSDNKKEITNDTDKYNSDLNKNSNNDNTVDDNLPVKNGHKQKNQNTNNSNQDNIVDYKDSDTDNYDTNIRSNDASIYKNNGKSKNKDDAYNDDSEKNNHKNSNNGNSSEKKNKKDK